ncbi:MAG: hypothetical protein ABH934_02010 [Chloroflexota bacterium]
MARKIYTPEQIINKLREAEIYLSQGSSIGEASRKIGGNRADLLPMAQGPCMEL